VANSPFAELYTWFFLLFRMHLIDTILADKCSAVAKMGDRLATIHMGRKLDGCAPFLGDSKITWPGPRPTSVPSFILIHPTVWPQYTNVTDRQTDRQTGQTTVLYHRANRFGNGRSKNCDLRETLRVIVYVEHCLHAVSPT